MKASSILLIFPHTSFHQATTVLRHSNGEMLSNLLGLLVLSCLCSAMPNSIGSESEEEGSTMDPNTFNTVTSDETASQETSQEGGMSMKGYPMKPSPRGGPLAYGNMTYPVNPVPDIPDSEICDMMLNGPVQPPIDQIPFHCLCTHCKGTLGHKGDMGDRGRPGQPGSPGRRGMQGFKGRPGFTGGAGIKGQKGDMGEKGSVGMTGFSGSKGSRGYKGEKGELGMTGPEGALGPQGETGTCPASCKSDPGPAGPQGAPGPAGGRGLPGLKGTMGTKGLKGDPGTLGTPGTDGPKGPKGDMGEQGICNCTDGANGRNGTKGDKGSMGQKGDTGSDGVTGPEGPMGQFGPMGRPGPCSPAIQSAFSACINASFPPKNMPVVFPHILTNEQGHFNALTGMYMAPVNGTYVFSYHLAVRTKALHVGLFRNFFPVVKTTEATDRATASQTVVLHLAMGDRLWLQVKNEVTNGMFTDSDSSSTFTGYLLHPDSCEFSFGRDFMPPPMEGDYNWDGPDKTNTHTVPPTTTPP